jgi:hypothetical protein
MTWPHCQHVNSVAARFGTGRLSSAGNIVQAREYLTRALEIFERLGTPREPIKSDRR